MIDYTTVRATIEQYLGDNFSTVAVVFENTSLENKDEEHISISEDDVETALLGMTDDQRLVNAVISIEIFTKRGIGTEKAREIASELITLIEANDSGIAFGVPIFSSVGAVDGAELYQHVLSYPYSYVYGQAD